jgi:hypothetical protein
MADSGLTRFIKNGLLFAFSKAAATSVGLRTLADPATSFYFNIPTVLPSVTSTVTVDPSGNIAYTTPGGGGSVTSVGVAVPGDLTVSGGPITTSGTITIARSSQAAKTFLAAPTATAGVPSYRVLDSADIPQTLTSAWITNFDTQVRASRLNQMTAPNAAVDFNGQRITGLATPVNAQDSATKAYVDAAVEGRNNSITARLAATGNVNLAAPGASFDGIAAANGDPIFLSSQTNASENGVWTFNGAAAAMTRWNLADSNAEVKPGLYVFVSEGATLGNNGYTLTTDGPINLGATALTFTQTSGAGQVLAGAGLTKTGNTIDVGGTANRITVGGDSVDIASNYAGQSSIVTVGTITTGAWNGSAIPVAFGGTGATTAAQARTNLGTVGVFRQSFTNANLTSGLLTVTHNLGQKYVQVSVYDEADNRTLTADNFSATNTNTMTIDLTSFGTLSGTWNVVVIG